MRRMIAIAVMCLFVLGSSLPIQAQNPGFNKLSASISGTTLSVTFKLTGLGDATTVAVTLSDDVSFTCTSHGQGGTVTTSAHQTLNETTTFTVGPKPGTSSGTVSFTPDCPGSQKVGGPVVFSNVSISASATTGTAGPVAITNVNGVFVCSNLTNC